MAADQGRVGRGGQGGGRHRRGRRGPHASCARPARRFTGRCPFHEERTPSFSVNPVDKLYYCFGCGAGGDAITFVEETERLDFVGAIEWLAERFSVPLEYEEASPEQDASRRRRERLYALLDAGGLVLRALPLGVTTAGEPAREYLPGAASARRCAATTGSASRPAATTLARKAREKGSRATARGRPGSSTGAETTTSAAG